MVFTLRTDVGECRPLLAKGECHEVQHFQPVQCASRNCNCEWYRPMKSLEVQRERPTSKYPSLAQTILIHLGDELRKEYADPNGQKVTGELGRLLKRAAQVVRACHEPVDQEFVDEVISLLPELRVFAISLEKDVVRAEDLVQEAALKALSQHERFERGTSLRSLAVHGSSENYFLTIVRRRAREVEDATGLFAETLTFEPDQYHKLAHEELLAALDALPPDQREVLLLVTVEEMSYEDAAVRMNCAVGTIKSRVNRARRHLAEKMALPATIRWAGRASGRRSPVLALRSVSGCTTPPLQLR